MSITMVSCSNIKSETYDGNNTRSENNARWENVVNLDLQPGDMLNLESATIHVRGISSDSTVELTNKNNDAGMSDSKLGFRFTGYVNDNGQNTIAHPFVGSNQELVYPLLNASLPEFYDLEFNPNEDAGLPLANIEFIGPFATLDNDGDGNARPNAGELITSDESFSFSYHEFSPQNNMISPFNDNLKTYYTEKGSWNSVSGHKYTLISEDYLGPYRKADSPEEFWGSEIEPQYFDVKVDLNGPLYESPSTIANEINHQLNNSDPYGTSDTLVRDSYNQAVQLPSLTGKLLKVRKCNGFIDYDYAVEEDSNEGRKKLWGNLAVRDFKKWQGIDALMRADIAFDYQYGFSLDIVKCYQPCFLMPNGDNEGARNYPRTHFDMIYAVISVSDINASEPAEQYLTKSPAYTTLPQYYMFCTNMTYNEDNIKRIQTYMRNTEKYDGVRTENEDSDINNWRSHFDIGFSHQTRTTSNATDQSASRHMYYCSQGNYNLTSSDSSNPTDYAFARPYFPYSNKVDSMATSRSDIPDVGYLQMCSNEESIQIDGGHVEGGFCTIRHFTQAPPHFFKNNKNGDASIAMSSRYNSAWKTKAIGDHMTFGSCDSLSQQYDVGAYPVTIKSAAPNPAGFELDLDNTFYVGSFNDLDPALVPSFSGDERQPYTYKIVKSTGGAQQTHGGYDFLQFDPNNGQFVKNDDAYLYSLGNYSVASGREAVIGKTFDGQYTIDWDEGKHGNWFVLDVGNTYRFAITFWDENDVTHCNVYQLDGFNTDGSDGVPNYEPLGSVDWEGPTRVTDLDILSLDSSSPSYIGNIDYDHNHVNGNPPVITSFLNPEETVIGMMLYRSSATQKSDGSWDISSDFALPAMHQGMWCVSTSFMDNPGVFLTNAQRYDDKAYINDTTDTNNISDWDLMTLNKNTNYIEVGCSNPTFQWSNDLTRATFSNLHTTKRLGIEDMPKDDNGDYVTTTIGNEVVKVKDNIIKNGFLFQLVRSFQKLAPPNAYISNGTNMNYNLNYAIGGISFHSLYGEGSTENHSDLDDMREITEDSFIGTLLYKLGFQYKDLFPKYGLPTNLYDYSKIKSQDPSERYRKLLPLTTNPLVDQSSALDLNVKDATDKDRAGEGLPMYNLSVGSTIPVNLDGSTSEQIVATNLPIKANTPYYLVYCNLSTGNFVENTDSFNVIGVVLKKFIASDFVYGEAGNPFEIRIPQKVTRISIEIRDATGTVVSLDPNSSILLKLYKNIPSE